jgi:hypothetical protein
MAGYKVGRTPLRSVPEQRGGDVLEKLRDFNLATKRLAKREVLAELAAHYMQHPDQRLSGYEIAKQLLDKAEELNG